MSQQRHVIKRQTVEITLVKKEDAWPIQQALSRIFQHYFPAILDRCLSELSHPDGLHRIDLLELDLGELDASRLEADILESIEATLRQALHEHIKTSQVPSTAKQQADPMQAHLELFERFVLEGCLPWWADSTQTHVPEKSFTALLNNDPQTLRLLLIKLIQEPRCLQRLISYFEDNHLLAMMVLVTSVPEEPATSLLQTLQAVQAQLYRLRGVPVLQLRATLWQSLLQVTVAGAPPVSRHAEFLTAVTSRWARLQGISHKILVSCIQKLSTSAAVAINNPWLQANELSSARQPSDKLNEPISRGNGVDLSSAKTSPDTRIRLERIWPHIERPQGSGQDSPETLDRMTAARMQEIEQRKERLLMGNKSKAKARFTPPHPNPLPEGEGVRRRSYFMHIPKGEGGRAPKSTTLISHEHQPRTAIISKRYALLKKGIHIYPGQAPKPSREPVAANISATLLPPQLVHKLAESQGLDRPSAKINISPDDQTSMEQSDEKQTLSDTDALYINNAGLCILWPFLVPFFERLELVQDGRFHNLAAKQCAVSLLHYMATEELKPLEYWLPFNKLLCGMAIDEVYESAAPLTTTQIEACDDLLSAVISNAPILNNISLNGFRGSFLIRQGVISAGPGSWLLHVERETYDLVLDRFPWSWQWLKLPWMEYPLRVEW